LVTSKVKVLAKFRHFGEAVMPEGIAVVPRLYVLHLGIDLTTEEEGGEKTPRKRSRKVPTSLTHPIFDR
jgi:hypothetical protein